VETQPLRPSIYTQFGRLLLAYFGRASHIYEGYPEQLSVMMITSLELWESLDKLTIAVHPLLQEYSPEIELSFLGPLLLSKFNDMRRLHQIETYLARRHDDCSFQNRSVFSNPQHLSFTVRYFRDSPDHHHLLRQIEEQATRQRHAKPQETSTNGHFLKTKSNVLPQLWNWQSQKLSQSGEMRRTKFEISVGRNSRVGLKPMQQCWTMLLSIHFESSKASRLHLLQR